MSTLEERRIGAVVGALVADAAGKYLFLIYLKQAKDLSFHGIRIQCTTQSCLYNCVHLRWLPDRTLQNFKACMHTLYICEFNVAMHSPCSQGASDCFT